MLALVAPLRRSSSVSLRICTSLSKENDAVLLLHRPYVMATIVCRRVGTSICFEVTNLADIRVSNLAPISIAPALYGFIVSLGF